MNRQTWLVFLVVLGLISGGAVYLGTLQARQTLGKPGVKVVNEPIYVAEPNVAGSSLPQTNRLVLAGTNSVFLPPQVLEYKSEVLPVQKLVWDWLPKDTIYGQRMYVAPDGFGLQNTVVLMGRDRTSIHQPQYCLVGSGWRIDSQERTNIAMDRPSPYDLPIMKLTTTAQFKNERGEMQTKRGLYLYWFVADNRLTADHRERMWWMARDLIRESVLQRWAYVTYFSVCRPGQEEATFNRMKEFIRHSAPHFQLTGGAAAKVARNP